MNILFLTIVYPVNETNLYTDLMQEFIEGGHNVYVITSTERRYKKSTSIGIERRVTVLRLKTLNLQKTNLLEKGLATLLLEYQYISAIKKYYGNISFDLVIYSTPPVTFARVINYCKEVYKANTYLLLKDIFPQNAVDLGLVRKDSLLYKYFRNKEKKLYRLSDFIGCMSPKNVEYLIKHNANLACEKIEVCPNSIIPKPLNPINNDLKRSIRNKYGIPTDRLLLLYGGNLGKPQGIDFILEVLTSNKDNINVFFLIVGSGTEYASLERSIKENDISNVKLIGMLPKNEYDALVQVSDIGLIFLDKRFTIPNFPSRLLSYMEYSLPVIAATDINTDIGAIIEQGKFGFWCESGDIDGFNTILNKILNYKDINQMRINSRKYLEDNYSAKCSYQIIVNSISKKKITIN